MTRCPFCARAIHDLEQPHCVFEAILRMIEERGDFTADQILKAADRDMVDEVFDTLTPLGDKLEISIRRAINTPSTPVQ